MIRTVQSENDSVKYALEELIEDIGALEYLKDNLQEDGTFGVISRYRRLRREQSFVRNPEQHLNLISVAHNPLASVHQVPIQSIQQSVTEGILILLEHKLEAREYFVYDV